MNHLLKSSLVKSSIALACLTATAANADEIEEIVVTAKGNQTLDNISFTTHIFNQFDIEAAQVKDIPELLNSLPGISITDSGGRGSNTGVFIRGTSTGQTIVLIDGVRVGSATLGSAALNSFPIETIERIEVIKGPFSGIYGADAAGGVIQLFTKTGGEGLGTASASFGSDALQEYSLSLHAGNDKHSFFVSAQTEDTNGFDRTTTTTGEAGDIDGFEEDSYSFSGKVTLSDSTIAKLAFLKSENTVEFDNGVTENEAFNVSLNITSELTDKITWKNTFGANEDESVTEVFFSDVTTERDSFGSELAIQVNDNSYLTVGIDYYEEDINVTGNFAETDRDNVGGFAQIQTSINGIDVTGSLRYDDNSTYGTDTNGSIALNYNITENVRASINYGTAFQAPSFNDLFFPGFGNPAIQPEESESYEASLLGSTNNIDWRVSIYKTDFENLIASAPSSDPAFPFGQAQNVNEAEIEGIEFEISTQFYDWNLGLNLDFLSAEDEGTGIELNDRAEQTLSFSADRDFGNLNLNFNVYGEKDRFDNGGTRLPSYALFDIGAQYQVNERLQISANVDNIFDKDYTLNLLFGGVERFNTAGRQAKLTVRYNF